MKVYSTVEGDQIDKICFDEYGFISGAIEEVLNANPRLASMGPILPAGLSVLLPEIVKEEKKERRIWG